VNQAGATALRPLSTAKDLVIEPGKTIGGATARRKLAFNLGVDPNSSFSPLSDELTRVATASAVGETGANVGLAFVTGRAGIAISVGGTSQQLRTMLRDKTAAGAARS
jgi:hypothetical protein